MNVINYFITYAPKRIMFSLFLGALSGICFTGLIPLLLSSLSAEENLSAITTASYFNSSFPLVLIKEHLSIIFFILCAAIFIMRTVSQTIMSKVSVLVTAKMRSDLYRKINQCSIQRLEAAGSAKVINVLTLDINRIVMGASVSTSIFVSLFSVIGLLIYLWFTNSYVFYFIIISLFFAVITYWMMMMVGSRLFSSSRLLMDNLQQSFQGLIYGAKELKLNKRKKDCFVDDELLTLENKIKGVNFRAETIINIANNFGDMFVFFILGVVCFVLKNYYRISNEDMILIVMIMFYISGPIGSILSSSSLISQAAVSYNRMETLLLSLKKENYTLVNSPPDKWRELSLNNISFAYESSSQFKVGPINLKFHKGEVTFIVGGNGSGKSTLSKIITQHYTPSSGEVFFEDTKITTENINNYRQCIASIYSDYYLFESVHVEGVEYEELNQKVNELLVFLKLSTKVEFSNGRFSTLSLSDGQRRRLALLVSLVEDKELYLFDEWAADQDPEFRDVFYNKLLPELKSRGKLVIVISHDDRYFHKADQIVKLEQGAVYNG